MDYDARPSDPLADSGLVLAPIHPFDENVPLRVCVLARRQPDPAAGHFVLLREYPGCQVYLGAVCDADARIQELVEIWVQSGELQDLAFSSYQERLTNSTLDQRWRSEFETTLTSLPEAVIVTGMETRNPSPVLVPRPDGKANARLTATRPAPWRLCQDDALLDSSGLPVYSVSAFRYLAETQAQKPARFVATNPDAPANAQVQALDALKTPEVAAVFNPSAGLVRVLRFTPLELETLFQILEGRPWEESEPAVKALPLRGIYAELRAWSGQQKSMPFLLHAAGSEGDRLNEVFCLKLSLLVGVFKEVRACVRAHQLPLLNLSPASFRVSLPDAGDQFPALWAVRCRLVKPGQAYPLPIAASEQKYFLRFGKVEPSVFLPEGLGAHSRGIGSVRRRNVLAQGDATILEGTLVAEDYLALDPHDVLWFKLPVGDERLECYAHVFTAEAVGPREARFRTLPMKLSDRVVELLKNTGVFPKAPYEIWPLLSSPSDLYSLGIIAARALLANSKTNVPALVDDLLGLARFIGKDPEPGQPLASRLRTVVSKEEKLANLVSPQSLVENELTPERARALIHPDLWFEAVAWLLRLFPGAGVHSYCQSFGDVSPLALESAFDAPIHDLENLVRRLRSVLVPTTAANQELADIILKHLAEAAG